MKVGGQRIPAVAFSAAQLALSFLPQATLPPLAFSLSPSQSPVRLPTLRCLMTNSAASVGQHHENLRLFDGRSGQEINSGIVGLARDPSVLNSDVLLVGEIHDDPVAHVAELKLLKELLLQSNRKWCLSLEFLESDTQLVTDEYLRNLVSEEMFKTCVRAPSNYDSDYRALIELCKEHGIPVIASNAPRRYVSLVRRCGREQLHTLLCDEAKRWLPPLPFQAASATYHERFRQTMSQMRSDGQVPAGMLDAQTLWDATMAHFITIAAKRTNPEQTDQRMLVVHIGGSFHIEGGLGLAEHLNPELRRISLIFHPGDLQHGFPQHYLGQADFIAITDHNLPRSY